MEWIHLSILLLVLTSSFIDAWKCPKVGTITSDDVVMEALYVADPDPDTGYMEFGITVHTLKDIDSDGLLVHSTVDYNTWKTREHDGTQLFINLWSFLARLIVSNVYHIWSHYNVVDQLGENKPRGVIDFNKVQNIFRQLHSASESAQKSWPWPYSCVTSSFFFYLKHVISSMKDIVQYNDYGSYSIKPLHQIKKNSKLGIDSNDRSYALEYLFNERVLRFIPSKTQSDVFYHSKLPRITLKKLSEGKEIFESFTKDWRYYRFTGFEDHVTSKCTDKSETIVGKEYYCKAKSFIVFSKQCAKLKDVTPCLYDPRFQDHFMKGRFVDYDELRVINIVASQTQTLMTAFKDKTTNNDFNGLRDLVTKYTPYVTVKDAMCVPNWPKAFDCVKNVMCGSIKRQGFDCNGEYTCRIKTLYRFDCIVKFVMTSTKKYTDLVFDGYKAESPEGLRAKADLKVWLSYIPMGGYTSLSSIDINDVILSTQKTANIHVTSYDTAGLTTFSNNLPPVTLVPVWAKNAACQTTTIAQEYRIYCVINPLIQSIFMFLDSFKNSKQATIKELHPNVNYIVLIEQLQIQRVQNYIVLQTEAYFRELSSQLQDNFAALSTYFATLANYDKTKAESDIAYIVGRLKTFKEKITELCGPVQKMLKVVLDFSIGANAAGLVQRTAELGVAIAQVANPASVVLGGSSILDLIGTMNELAQTGVQTAIITYMGNKAMPDLIAKATKLGKGFAANDLQFVVAKNLIEGLKKTTNVEDSANTFLKQYDSYDPKVLRSDITVYGTKFETVAEQLCNSAFSGETIGEALLEVGLANKGECTELSSAIAQLVTVYEEIYDYQFDLMDSLSDAARAYLSYAKANEMKEIYTKGARMDQAFLQKTAVNTFMISTMNAWQIVTEYCDILTYTSGGVVPAKCMAALTTPSHEAVAEVLAYNPKPLCHIDNEITDFRDIPIKSSSSGDTGYIDLEKLYKGETVTFKVPNFQWLKDQGWVGNQDSDKAIYIKRFEIFLPPMSGTSQHTIEVSAAPGLVNYLKPGGITYRLQISGYTARYTENSYNCYSQRIDNPYALCNSNDLAQICVTSNGYVNRKIQPSIFNEWRITASNLPTNEKEPKPVTNFKLQVGITMCMVNMSSNKKRGVFNAMTPSLRKRGALQCCASTQYWNGAACTTCPAGSSQKLKGYYCQ